MRESRLDEKEGIRTGPWEKRVDSTVKEGRFQGSEEKQAKSTSLEEEESSMRE